MSKKEDLSRFNVFFDLDGTLAEWKEAATPEDLMAKDYFFNLEPEQQGLLAVKLLQEKGANVYVLSAYMPETEALRDKNRWCDKYLNVPMSRRIYVPCGVSKASAIHEATMRRLTENDILVDDHTPNLLDWEENGGVGIKYINSVNCNGGRFKGYKALWAQEIVEFLVAKALIQG